MMFGWSGNGVAWVMSVIALLSAAPAPEPVATVFKEAPTSERQLFDRNRKPPEMTAEQAAHFDAFTTCYYSGSWQFSCDSDTRQDNVGGYSARVVIRGVSLRLKLNSVLYLPPDVTTELLEHERGHQMIGERAYRKADRIATALAQPLIGRTFEGQGPSPAAAIQAACNRAGQEWFQDYLAAIRGPAQRVHDLYDEITSHGLNREMVESAAIDNAVTLHLSRRSN